MRRRDYVRIAVTDPFCVVLFSLFAVVITGIAFFFVGLKNVAWFVGNGGTLAVLFGGLAYAAWRDPEGRFPEDSFGVRLGKILGFKRE